MKKREAYTMYIHWKHHISCQLTIQARKVFCQNDSPGQCHLKSFSTSIWSSLKLTGLNLTIHYSLYYDLVF